MPAKRIGIRGLHATKATAIALVDNTPATYLPPILCATCNKAELPGLLRPQGFTVNELKEVTARSDELIWDLATVRQSAAQCRLCQLLLKCLEGCRGFDTAGTSDVFVQLQPIGEYQEMGDLTLWMAISRKKPRRTMEAFIRCQLEVGLRIRRDIDGLNRAIACKSLPYLGDYGIPTGSSQEGNLDGITEPFSSVTFPSDHPPRNRVGTGFILSDPSRPPSYPTCERELSHAPSSLWRNTELEPAFDRVRSALDSFFETCAHPESARSGLGSSSTEALRPFSNSHERYQGRVDSRSASRGLLEQTSSLCIQLLGRRPKGPIDQNSWRYEVENIMSSRGLDISHADFRLAAYWIHVCGLWHAPFCPPLVWTAPGSSTFALRVIDVKNQCITTAPPRCKYAALSYTWGKAKQCKLKQDKLDEMCQPGGLRKFTTELPRTIRDALLVCQRLNIRYLWVDALCIVQDDPNDRDAQIGSMGYVYGGAHLTIVSGSGDDADAGLSGVSLPRKDHYFQSKIGGLELITAPANGVNSLLRSPWYTRGWTFQELVLSKRILAFTKEQMLFFCVKAFFQEDMVLEPVNGLLRRKQGTKDFFDRHITLSGRNFNNTSSLYTDQALESYSRFLASYLHRELSYEGDILNAFAGILDALSNYLGTFSWGIPVVFPNRMLTWNFRNPLRRRSGFPSWSWAGWKGYTGDLNFHKSLSLTRVDSIKDTNGPFFFSFLENGDIISFGRVHSRNPEQHRQDQSIITDQDWIHIRPNFGQYLLLITRTVFLAVDAEVNTAGNTVDHSGLHAYSLRWGPFHLGQIYLNHSWRCKQPAELEFVSIAKSILGESLMLIQRSGPVAYRIQMVDQPVSSMFWGNDEPRLQSIILG